MARVVQAVVVTMPDPELVAAVDDAMAPAAQEWARGVLAVEGAYQPDMPDVLRKMAENGLIDPERE